MIATRDELVARLIRAGELQVLGGDQAETDSYFDTQQFRFHGPAGLETDYPGLANYFKAVRAAFDDRSIRRGIIIAEGSYIACQTWIEGRFVREFTHSPAGPLGPNGQRVVWDLSNIFRFDDQGRLVEEWVRTDHRSFLRQLSPLAAPAAARAAATQQPARSSSAARPHPGGTSAAVSARPAR
jgi:predicted ester cyclase